MHFRYARYCFLAIISGVLTVPAIAQLPGIKSPFDEQSPVLSPDGSVMYFTVTGHPENMMGKRDPGDIWAAVRTPDGWTAPDRKSTRLNSSHT